MKLIFFAFAIFVIQFIPSESCKCAVLQPKDQYCDSSFTARVHVSGQQDAEEQNKKVYLVHVEHIYRGDDAARTALNDGKLYTMRHSASCGVDLKTDQSYIVTGQLSNGKTSINNCGYHKLTSDVSDDVKRGFEGEYNSQCS